MPHDFRICKLCDSETSTPAYFLPHTGTVFKCPRCKFHYLDYLDDEQVFDPTPPTPGAAKKHAEYIDRVLQFNRTKFENRIQVLQQHVSRTRSRCLDVGAGGGSSWICSDRKART